MTQPNNDATAKPFWEHVADLRRLLYLFLFLLISGASIIHYYRDTVIPFLLEPLGTDAPPLQFLSPLEPLFFILKIDFVGGFLVSLPLITIAAYQFINPTPWRRALFPVMIVLTSSLLAFVGAAYAYFVVVPIVLGFMNSLILPGTIAAFTATGFMNFLLGTAFMLVLIFQIPVLTVLGAALGLFNPKTFSHYRRNVYLGIFVATAVVTPTTDVLTLFLVSMPAIVVTEVGVLIGSLFYRSTARH